MLGHHDGRPAREPRRGRHEQATGGTAGVEVERVRASSTQDTNQADRGADLPAAALPGVGIEPEDLAALGPHEPRQLVEFGALGDDDRDRDVAAPELPGQVPNVGLHPAHGDGLQDQDHTANRSHLSRG